MHFSPGHIVYISLLVSSKGSIHVSFKSIDYYDVVGLLKYTSNYGI